MKVNITSAFLKLGTFKNMLTQQVCIDDKFEFVLNMITNEDLSERKDFSIVVGKNQIALKDDVFKQEVIDLNILFAMIYANKSHIEKYFNNKEFFESIESIINKQALLFNKINKEYLTQSFHLQAILNHDIDELSKMIYIVPEGFIKGFFHVYPQTLSTHNIKNNEENLKNLYHIIYNEFLSILESNQNSLDRNFEEKFTSDILKNI